jgi:hypothetical protein
MQREWALSDTQLGALTGVVALVVAVLAARCPLWVTGSAARGPSRAWPCCGAWPRSPARSPPTTGGSSRRACSWGSVKRPTTVLTGAFMAGASLGAVLGVALGVLHRLVVSDGRVARYGSPLPVDGAPEPVDVPGAADRARPQSAPHLRPSGQRPAAVRGRSAHHLVADLSGACPRAADGEGRTGGHGRHPGHEPRDGGLRVGHRPAEAGSGRSGGGRPPSSTPSPPSSSSGSRSPWDREAQLALLALGGFFVAGPAGAAGALVTSLTPESIRATALGTLALANNLLSLAAGPFVVGLLADPLGLVGAMRLVLVSVPVMVVLMIGRHDARASRPVAVAVRV